MDKILTIIIPTFNMENYLRYCLDSLLINENFLRLEVLVVNDGSKDCTSSIAHEYENTYPNVFRVIDKENGHYGSCVNRGLEEARGKYVKVLDADDSFDTVNFEAFVAFLTDVDADLILSDFALVNPKREIKKIIKYRFGNEYKFDIRSICNKHAFEYMQMHAVTYRCENLKNFGYRQTEGISYSDQQWIFLPMIYVKTVVCFPHFVYKYLIGREGQTINPSCKLKSKVQIARCATEIVNKFEKHKSKIVWNELRKYLYSRMIPLIKDVYVYCLTHYRKDTKKILTEFDNELKICSKEVYELIGSKEISSLMSFRYIDYWRKNKDTSPLTIKILSKMYLTYIKIRHKLHKEDEMAIPTSV